MNRLRVGMYQRYYGGNMDEGWTRWLLEQFHFPFTSLKDAEVKKGGLENKYDVIILPSDSVEMMTGEREPEPERLLSVYPPEYRNGFGEEGVNSLKAFVENGGTLLTFGESGTFAIDKLDLPVRNVVADEKPPEFRCPGSTLKVDVDNGHPLAYGMPESALGVFLRQSQAYEVVPGPHNERVERVVTFVDRDVLKSGWLLGEEKIAEKAAVIAAGHGKGRVVLIGFRPQHRAQTHGTYKFVFNTLLTASPNGEAPATGLP